MVLLTRLEVGENPMLCKNYLKDYTPPYIQFEILFVGLNESSHGEVFNCAHFLKILIITKKLSLKN